MKCNYDTCGWKGCLTCGLSDCVRDDIYSDPNSKKRYSEPLKKREKYPKSYARADERWKRKQQGLPIEPKVYKCVGRRTEYQREYRAAMPEEQKERYRERQRIRQRAYRERKKYEVSVLQQQ